MYQNQAIDHKETSTDSGGPQSHLMMDVETPQKQAQTLLVHISSSTEQILTLSQSLETPQTLLVLM